MVNIFTEHLRYDREDKYGKKEGDICKFSADIFIKEP